MNDYPDLPAAPEAERSVLSGILSGSLDADVSLGLLTDEDFSLETNRRVLRSIRRLVQDGRPVDSGLVYQCARDAGWHDVTLSFLVDFSDMPRLTGLEGYLDVLREKSTLRRVASAALKLANRCCTPGEDVREILSDSERIIRACSDRLTTKAEWLSPAEIMRRGPGGLNAFLCPDKAGIGIPTPWPFLTEQTCGWHAGELVLVAGRPSMGKSVISLQAAHAAAVAGYGVAFFSLEMTSESLIQRLISSVGTIDAHSMRSGRLDAESRRVVSRTAGEIAELPIRIDDTRCNTVPAVLAQLRKLRSTLEVGLVIIDHMQLMRSVKSYSSKHHELSDISHALKLAAGEFNCTVMLLSQLNRDCEKDKRLPQLSDLAECGSLEQDADVVMFVHRPEMYWRDKPELRGQATLLLSKQRNGPTGSKKLLFQHGYQRFVEIASEAE